MKLRVETRRKLPAVLYWVLCRGGVQNLPEGFGGVQPILGVIPKISTPTKNLTKSTNTCMHSVYSQTNLQTEKNVWRFFLACKSLPRTDFKLNYFACQCSKFASLYIVRVFYVEEILLHIHDHSSNSFVLHTAQQICFDRARTSFYSA